MNTQNPIPEMERGQFRITLSVAIDAIVIARQGIEESDVSGTLESLDIAAAHIALVHEAVTKKYVSP